MNKQVELIKEEVERLWRMCYNDNDYIDDVALDMLSRLKDYINSLQEEFVSKEFEEQVKELWDEQNTGHDYIVVHSYNIFYGLCLDIANWQKEQIEKQNENAMQYVKEHHSPSEVRR